MSQTIQSIHSLSMQLNQAASSLRGSSFQLDELEASQMAEMGGGGDNNTGSHTNTGGSKFMINTGGKISKLFGKKATRVKELLLQNLGKADRTTDGLFQMYEENFYRQQSQALKLQKEFKSYINSLKGAQEAGKSLNACIKQSTGDYQSARHDLVCENLSQLEHLEEDLMEKLRSQVLVSVSEYLSQFNELRDKISKRRRKLIDFDSSRRIYELMLAQVARKRQQVAGSAAGGSLQSGGRNYRSALALTGGGGAGSGEDSLQSAASQLVDEARLLKLREQYNYCKIMYETINGELHEELPMVYEKKMKNLLMTLQNYFSLEAQFHSNAGKLFATASDVIDELPMASIRSSHNHHHHQHQLHHQHLHQAKEEPIASGSSGMGSSGGDSSLESSSSLAASGNGSPTGDDAEHNNHNHHHRHHDHQMAMEIGTEQDEVEEGAGLHAALPEGEGQEKPEEVEEEEQDEDEVVMMAPEVDEMDRGHEQQSGKDFGFGETDAVSQEEPEDEDEADQKDQQKQQDLHQVVYSEIVDYSEIELVSGDVRPPPGEQFDSELERGNGNKDDELIDENGPEVGRELQPATETVVANVEPSLSTNDHPMVACDKTAPEVDSRDDDDDVDGIRQIGEEDRKCLYKVRTSYKYLAEDVDELCFEADEIIQVIEFDENQEQEEGWLMGVREVNGQRGLFPANFTRPV